MARTGLRERVRMLPQKQVASPRGRGYSDYEHCCSLQHQAQLSCGLLSHYTSLLQLGEVPIACVWHMQEKARRRLCSVRAESAGRSCTSSNLPAESRTASHEGGGQERAAPLQAFANRLFRRVMCVNAVPTIEFSGGLPEKVA